MADLTVIILTKNEEKNIEECIRSVLGIAKRIVVVDSGSDDQTTQIAEGLGAEILVHPYINQAKQYIYGEEACNPTTEWIMRLDADERLTKESAAELEEILTHASGDINGVIIRFEVTFMGKKLRHGGIYPFRKLLVYRRGKGYMEDRAMDEHIVLREGRAVELTHDSEHKDYKDLTYWISKHNGYASREVEDYVRAYKEADTGASDASALDASARAKRFIKYHIYYKLPMGMRSWLYYFYRYYVKGGFLDGKEGKIFAFLQAYWYRFLVDAKIYEWELQDNKTKKD